jgi:hypothetical protein
MTNCETFCDADPLCGNMFPPQCGAGGTCGKPRLSSLSWQQLETWRRWSKLAELNGAKTDRTGAIVVNGYVARSTEAPRVPTAERDLRAHAAGIGYGVVGPRHTGDYRCPLFG